MSRIKILGIPFDRVDKFEALSRIIKMLDGKPGIKSIVATPNPEMILAADKNESFKSLLNKTDLNIADGTGILWAAEYIKKTQNIDSNFIKFLIGVKTLFISLVNNSYIKKTLPERVTGTDMLTLICKNIPGGTKVFLLGGSGGAAEKTAAFLKENYGTEICGINEGSGDPKNDTHIVNEINHHSPDILFVAFGAPKQEFWISRNLPALKNVKVAMGVGGAFDFIGGKIKRAPSFMREHGLEWLYRLLKQPSRIGRIYNATIKFPLTVIKASFKSS